MRNIRVAFAEFWGGFYNRSSLLPFPAPIPAYQAGYAITRDAQGRPIAPAFPYITYQLALPGFMDGTIITANVWDKNPSNPGFMGLVDDVLTQIGEAIPTKYKRLREGVILDCGDEGKIWLLRSNPFIDFLDDPEDQAISRGIVHVVIKNYVP